MFADGVLFFPVTPFGPGGEVDETLLADHVASGVEAGAGGVFAACGTGEFHALDPAEVVRVTRTAVEATAGRVPVFAGAGGSVATAIRLVRDAADAGADGILLLPPYLVGGPADGLRGWVEQIVGASELPVVLYNRATAVYRPADVVRLAEDTRIAGFKDGVGDLAQVQRIVSAVRPRRPDFLFFNGLLTAELSQGAYRGVGVPLYSSAAFAMAPEIASAYHRAYVTGDETGRQRLLTGFYEPLVALRDEVPGFGVSLIKAGLRLRGFPVGSVRAPLVDPDADQTRRLGRILEAGSALAADLAATA